MMVDVFPDPIQLQIADPPAAKNSPKLFLGVKYKLGQILTLCGFSVMMEFGTRQTRTVSSP